jgi:uncharacterized protein HemX
MSEPEPKPAATAASSAATDRAATDKDWASLAASLATEKTARAANPAEQPAVVRGAFASSLALVLALISISVAGMLWWQYRQFYVSLDQTDVSQALSLERVRAEQRALADKLDGADEEIALLRELNTTLGERIDTLPGRLVEIEQRLDTVQGGSFDARATMLRAEAEYYLTVANTELALVGNWEGAITALELADGRLAEIANPTLAPVREAIAGELLALRSVRLPDTEGIVFSLGRLAGRVDALPLRADLPAGLHGDTAVEPEPEPGLERLWFSIKRTLLGLVRVERRDDPVPAALSAAERVLVRQQLAVELELARIAVLRGQRDAFQSSLDGALAILERSFSADSGDVDGAAILLREMRGLAIDPPRPEISGSLNLLRGQTTGAR